VDHVSTYGFNFIYFCFRSNEEPTDDSPVLRYGKLLYLSYIFGQLFVQIICMS